MYVARSWGGGVRHTHGLFCARSCDASHIQDSAEVTISYTSIEANTAVEGAGMYDAEVSLVLCRFAQPHARCPCLASYAQDTATVSFKNVTVSDNQVRVFHLLRSTSSRVSSLTLCCLRQANVANTGSGGALKLVGEATAAVNATKFFRNTAAKYDASAQPPQRYFLERAEVASGLTSVACLGGHVAHVCSRHRFGGDIALAGSASLTVRTTTFNSSFVKLGLGLVIYSTSSGQLSLADSQFVDSSCACVAGSRHAPWTPWGEGEGTA